jgi:hypothetical protein
MAHLREICDLSEQYNALVMVDDSHATGFLGPDDKGTPADVGVDHWVGTLGKALGGVSGGFVAGRKEVNEVNDILRQRSRELIGSGAERSGFDPLMAAKVVDGDPPATPVHDDGNLLDAQLLLERVMCSTPFWRYAVSGFDSPVGPFHRASLQSVGTRLPWREIMRCRSVS